MKYMLGYFADMWAVVYGGYVVHLLDRREDAERWVRRLNLIGVRP